MSLDIRLSDLYPSAFVSSPVVILNSTDLKYHYLMKCVVVGGESMGKTSLVRVLCGDSLDIHERPTVGCDVRALRVNLGPPDNRVLKLQLTDISGNPRFHHILEICLRGVGLAVLVFNPSTPLLYKVELPTWIERTKRLYRSIRILVVANKIDLATPEDLEEARRFVVSELELPFFMVCCLTGQGVPGLLECLTDLASQPIIGRRDGPLILDPQAEKDTCCVIL